MAAFSEHAPCASWSTHDVEPRRGDDALADRVPGLPGELVEPRDQTGVLVDLLGEGAPQVAELADDADDDRGSSASVYARSTSERTLDPFVPASIEIEIFRSRTRVPPRRALAGSGCGDPGGDPPGPRTIG